MQQTESISGKSSLDGLWVVLVAAGDPAESEQLPVMARAGNDQTFLLGFKDVRGARTFVEQSGVEDAHPRMVVKGNRGALLRIATENGASGVLVDYDPTTQKYATADTLY